MMVLGVVTYSLATAALLVGLGSDLAGEDRAPVSDDPTTRLERALLGPTQDEPTGDAPAGSGRPQDDAGPTRLVAVMSLGIAATQAESPAPAASRGPSKRKPRMRGQIWRHCSRSMLSRPWTAVA